MSLVGGWRSGKGFDLNYDFSIFLCWPIYQIWYIGFMKYKVKLLKPAEDFLFSLEGKLQAKALREIELLASFGPFLREPHSKSIKGYEGLFELRVKQGSNICRFFYYFHKGNVYVVTSGYIKKEQKTKKSEIIKAVELMKRFEEEQNEKA